MMKAETLAIQISQHRAWMPVLAELAPNKTMRGSIPVVVETAKHHSKP